MEIIKETDFICWEIAWRYVMMIYDDKERRFMMAEACLTVGGFAIPRKDYWNPDRESRRKRPPEMRKSFQIAEVHETHHEIARRLVLGQKPKEIAKDLNIGYGTVLNVRRSPIIQEQMKIMGGARDAETHDIAKQIRDLTPKCVKVLEEIIDDDEVGKSLKMKASLAVLDRAGHAVPKNVNVKGMHAVISAQDLIAIKERAAEIGMIADEDDIIDV